MFNAINNGFLPDITLDGLNSLNKLLNKSYSLVSSSSNPETRFENESTERELKRQQKQNYQDAVKCSVSDLDIQSLLQYGT